MPYHQALDVARELKKGAKKIGTTGRGIGPCYEDKAARVGIRAVDLLDRKLFLSKLGQNLKEKNFLLENFYGVKPVSKARVARQAAAWADYLAPYITDVVALIAASTAAGQNMLFEGAQGSQLDIDHGTYPFVTSSNPRGPVLSAPVPGWPPNRSRQWSVWSRPTPLEWVRDPFPRN